MSIKHTVKQTHATDSTRRMAMVIAERLRKQGIACEFISKCDTHGARLDIWDLRIDTLYVMVRRVSYRMMVSDAWHYEKQPRRYLQLGAADLSGLIDYVGRYRALDSATHWTVGVKQ